MRNNILHSTCRRDQQVGEIAYKNPDRFFMQCVVVPQKILKLSVWKESHGAIFGLVKVKLQDVIYWGKR